MNRRSPALLIGTLAASVALATGCTAEPTEAGRGADESQGQTQESGPVDLPEAEEPAGDMDEYATVPRAAQSDNPGQLAGITVTVAGGADRVVFDFGKGNSLPSYEVEYVDRLVLGEDEVIPLDGGAALRVTFSRSTPGADGMTAEDVPTNQGYDGASVRQVLLAENFAGTLVFGLGVTEEVEFRVGTAADSGQLTLELKHP